MTIKKIIVLIIMVLSLSGCTITYNLDISDKGYVESVDVVSNLDENLYEYSIPAFFGVIGYEDVDMSFLDKIDGVEYYNSKSLNKGDVVEYNYNYEFTNTNIKNSNILNSSYDTVVVKKYDHDEDGKNDYMLFTTGNDFVLFERFPNLEKVTINITSHYEVISSNADEVDRNVYTWYLTKDNLKSINLVYNPDKVVDYRTFWEKLMDGEYTNIFTISILLVGIGLIIYFVLKRKGDRMNKI